MTRRAGALRAHQDPQHPAVVGAAARGRSSTPSIQAAATAALRRRRRGYRSAAHPPGWTPPRRLRGVYASSAFAGAYIFALVIGVTGMTGEYRYETITAHLPGHASARSGGVAKHGRPPAGRRPRLRVVACVVVRARRRRRGDRRRGHDLGFGTDRLWPSVGARRRRGRCGPLLGIGIGTLIRNQVAALLVAVFVVVPGRAAADPRPRRGRPRRGRKWLPTTASSALTAPGTAIAAYLCPGGPARWCCSATPLVLAAPRCRCSRCAATSPDGFGRRAR